MVYESSNIAIIRDTRMKVPRHFREGRATKTIIGHHGSGNSIVDYMGIKMSPKSK